MSNSPVRVQICGTCRKPQSLLGLTHPPQVTPTRQMLTICRKWGKEHGRELEVSEVSCLSGCAVGMTMMVENDDAAVRLHSITEEPQLLQVLGELDAVLAGAPSAEVKRHVLSRTDWSAWRD